MKQPKFKFGDIVESRSLKTFKITEIRYIDDNYYYVNDEYCHCEDTLKEVEKQITITREKLIAAWQTVNDGITWNNSEDAKKIQGLLEYFGFKKIGQ